MAATSNSCFWLDDFFKYYPPDRDKMSNLYRGPSIDASYQVSVHLAKRFQMRRLKCEKLTDDGCQVMAKAHIALGKVSYYICKTNSDLDFQHHMLWSFLCSIIFKMRANCSFCWYWWNCRLSLLYTKDFLVCKYKIMVTSLILI
jgi:hypothetical protein